MKIRFILSENGLQLYRPDGVAFSTYTEIAQRLEQERQRTEQARRDAVPRLLQISLSVEQIA